jgi:cell division cycle 20-like protein 1 (cofactor of APC complex)
MLQLELIKVIKFFVLSDKENVLKLGIVQIWDVATNRKTISFPRHTARVGALAWNDLCIYSGSRDRFILQNDTRSNRQERRLAGHRQEVCGLKWSPDRQLLASGGNDNRLLVWNQSCPNPIQVYTDHTAAVKAIAWSPHQQGLLASGGGTADRHIRFWNTLTAQNLQSIDTGSQVSFNQMKIFLFMDFFFPCRYVI